MSEEEEIDELKRKLEKVKLEKERIKEISLAYECAVEDLRTLRSSTYSTM